MAYIDAIIEFLRAIHWIYSGPAITLLILYTLTPYGKLMKNEIDRKRVIGALIQDQAGKRYRRTMRPILDWIDERLSKDELERNLASKRVAFSHNLIQLTTLLAVLYPVLSILIQWLAGYSINLGPDTLELTGTTKQRLYATFWLACLTATLISILLIPRLRVLLFIALAIVSFSGLYGTIHGSLPPAIAFVGAFALSFTVALTVAGALTSTGAVAVSVAITFVGTIALTDVILYNFTDTIAMAGIMAFANIFPDAIINAVADAITGGVPITITIAVITTVAGAVAGVIGSAATYVQIRFRSSPTYTLVYILFLLNVLTLVLLFGPQFPNEFSEFLDESSQYKQPFFIVVFFGLFPLFNSIADFASIGLTRYLIRQGLTKVTAVNAALDLFGGAIIFTALACSLITYIHLVRLPNDQALLNLPGLFTDLQNPSTRGNYGWLAFMLASTLIPTLLHAMVGVFTLLLTYPVGIRTWVVNKLNNGQTSDIDGWQGTLAYCAMITASIWLPIFILYGIYLLDGLLILDWIINGFEAYARMIGAVSSKDG